MLKRVAVEIGMGTDIRGTDYTKAAVRALRDALWHNSLNESGEGRARCARRGRSRCDRDRHGGGCGETRSPRNLRRMANGGWRKGWTQ